MKNRTKVIQSVDRRNSSEKPETNSFFPFNRSVECMPGWSEEANKWSNSCLFDEGISLKSKNDQNFAAIETSRSHTEIQQVFRIHMPKKFIENVQTIYMVWMQFKVVTNSEFNHTRK